LDGVKKGSVQEDNREIPPELIMNNIRKIRRLRPNLNIVLQPVIVKGFINEALEYVRFAKEVNAGIHPTVPVLHNKREFKSLYPSDLEVASIDILLKSYNRSDPHLSELPVYRACFDPLNILMIVINGDVFPCCYINTIRTHKKEYYKGRLTEIDVDNFKLGNIFTDNIEDIVNSEKLMRIRKKIAETKNTDFSDRSNFKLNDETDYCKICLARWFKGC